MGKQVNFIKTLIIILVSLLIVFLAVTAVTLTVTLNKKREHLKEYYAEVNRQSIAVESDRKLIANKTTTHTYVKPETSRGFEKYFLEEEETVTKPTTTTTTVTSTTKTTKPTSTSTTASTTTKTTTKISTTTHAKPTTTKTTIPTTNPNYDYEYDNMDPSEIDDVYDDDYFADDNPDITTETQENISENY